MAMECVERGILNEGRIGMPLRFGNGEAALAMSEAVARRDGFGDVLAEGVRRAAEAIGPDAVAYALHVKGLEMVPFEPRTQTNLALGYATAPIGPRYDICEHDWDYDVKTGWPHTLDSSRTLGIIDRIPMEYVGIDKVRNFKALNNLWSGADALDLCIFAIAPTRVFTLEEMAEMVAAVTGWNTSSYEIMRFGERRNHLMRAYNIREGMTSADDVLPARFFDEPIAQGAWAGTRINRDSFAEAILAYYRMMGWDDAGRPRYETLVDHHLEWVQDQGHLPGGSNHSG
jgi:aldehyde:ferredoxin oxidoreductase